MFHQRAARRGRVVRIEIAQCAHKDRQAEARQAAKSYAIQIHMQYIQGLGGAACLESIILQALTNTKRGRKCQFVLCFLTQGKAGWFEIVCSIHSNSVDLVPNQ